MWLQVIDGTKGGHTCQSELERSHCGLLVNNLRTKMQGRCSFELV